MRSSACRSPRPLAASSSSRMPAARSSRSGRAPIRCTRRGTTRCAAPGSVHDRSNQSPLSWWPVRPTTRFASPRAGVGPGMRLAPRPSWRSGWSSSEKRRRGASRSGTVEITATVRLELCETAHEREAKAQAVRAAPRVRYAQREAFLPGEDPATALYIGPLEGLDGYMASLEDVGVQRALISIPRPWDPEQLRTLAGAIGLRGAEPHAG